MANNSVVTLNAGFDIGSENSFIGVTKGGGIEIILNDYSQRATPTYVALGDKQRELGVSAKQKQMMKIQSTYYAMKRLVGRQFKDVTNTEILPFPIESGPNGDVCVRINHNNEECLFSMTQIMAMFMTKLRLITEANIDVVINCPGFFTDAQRRALMDSAYIAGLQPLKICNDITAVATFYGFYRAHSAPDTCVAFIDVGHTTTQIAVCHFKTVNGTGSLNVLSQEFDPNLGGKNFDDLLADHFISQHRLTLNKRSRMRLLAECEKLKKQMSANSNRLPINVECLTEDTDFSSNMDRTLFEELATPYLLKIELMFKTCLENAQQKFLSMQKDASPLVPLVISAVEVVGGSTRIAKIKQLAKEVFGLEPTSTINQDEAVARGCALQAAMLSPTCKVRDFVVNDSVVYPIGLRYWFEGEGDTKVVEIPEVFPKGHVYPFVKKVTFTVTVLPLVIELYHRDDTPEAQHPIGQFKVTSPNQVALNRNKLTVLIRMDLNGMTNVISASLAVEDTSAPEQDDQGKPKMINLNMPVEVMWIRGKLNDTELVAQHEIENNLIMADKNWKDRIDARNELEEYVYEWRGKMEAGGFDQFVSQEEKTSFLSELGSVQDWLYQDEESEEPQSRAVYGDRLNHLKTKYSNDILFRTREFEERDSCLERLGKGIQLGRKLLETREQTEAEEGFTLDEPKVTKLQTQLEEKSLWFEEAHGYFRSSVLYLSPAITCVQIREQTVQIEAATKPIVDDLQRKREDKRRKEEEALKKATDEAAAAATAATNGTPSAAEASPAPGEKMEVDDESRSTKAE